MSTPTPQPPKNLHNTYIAPKPPYLRPILICGAIMALSTQRSLIAPGSLFHDNVLTRLSPTSAFKYATWVQNGIFYFLFGAHAVETALFTKRLSRHGVAVASWAWWKWVGTCFVGGKYCFVHFDREVGRFE